MSSGGDTETPVIGEQQEHDEESTYKPPAQKTLQDIVSADAEDESLLKYKQALLGQALSGEQIVVEPDNPKNVSVVIYIIGDVFKRTFSLEVLYRSSGFTTR